MNEFNILLNNNTNNKERYAAANNILINYDLFLNVEQILLGFQKLLVWLNFYPKSYKEYFKNNRLFLFDKLLNINKNMFIAIILALCNNYDPYRLHRFIIFGTNAMRNNEPIDVGWNVRTTKFDYFELLDYYEFDVCNIPNIVKADRQKIQEYRASKYSGKLIKCAIKNN